MRLVYVTARTPYGWDEQFIPPEIAEVARQGHEVLIVPRSPEGRSPAAGLGSAQVTVARQPLLGSRVLSGAAREVMSGRARAALARVVRGSRGALLARNLAVSPKGLWLAGLACRWGADHIHAHWASTTATIAMLASETSGIPWSFTAHRWDIVDNNLFEAKALSAAFVRFISESGVELARAKGIRGLGHNVRVIHMGVRVDGPAPRRAGSSASPVVLCAAKLLPVKGHCHLLDAMARLRERGVAGRLWVAGAGPLEGALRAQTARLGLQDDVRFMGPVPHEELLGLYRTGEVSVTVLPSVDLGGGTHEGIPVSLMEAMAHGVPVVGTTTGGIAELLHSGAGLMVPPGDPEALAEALARVLDDQALRDRLSAAGRERVEREFELGATVAEVLRHMAAARASGPASRPICGVRP